MLALQRSESKPCAAALQGGDNFGNVIANETKASVLGVLFNDPTECELRVRCHGVGFVKDNKFNIGRRSIRSTVAFRCRLLKELLRPGKFFDFVANHVNASCVTGVELQGHALVGRIASSVHTSGGGDNCGSLSRSGRPVQEQMRQVSTVNEIRED